MRRHLLEIFDDHQDAQDLRLELAAAPGSLGGNGLTPEKEISLAGLSPLQNTFLAFSLSNIPRFHFGRSVTMSTRADLSQEIAYPLSSV